jgi:predicted nucleic acid-binding Zn ribbon protein
MNELRRNQVDGNSAKKHTSPRVYPRSYRSDKGKKGLRADLANPVGVEGVLRMALKSVGLDKEIAKYEFVLRWAEIVGPEIAKRTRPECIRNNTLVIRVVSSAWAQELSFQKDVILNRLKRMYPEHSVVQDVHFYVAG